MKINYWFWRSIEKAILRFVFQGSLMGPLGMDMQKCNKWKAALWRVNQRKIISLGKENPNKGTK